MDTTKDNNLLRSAFVFIAVFFIDVRKFQETARTKMWPKLKKPINIIIGLESGVFIKIMLRCKEQYDSFQNPMPNITRLIHTKSHLKTAKT